MVLPDYWLKRPSADFDEKTQIAFDEMLKTALSIGGCPTIPVTLPWSKWQFLCYVADHHDLALHGSGDPNIALFEPRQSNDLNEFGNQKAVYAASDGLWAMFFAIVDRARVMSITNACIRLEEDINSPLANRLSQVSPGERARSTSCHVKPSQLSHPWHWALAKSISHSWQASCLFNPWRNSQLHRRIFLSCCRSVGMMTSGFRNMQQRCKRVRHGRATCERLINRVGGR
jgi:hypothetical protein